MHLYGLEILFHVLFVMKRHVEASRVTYVTMSESTGMHSGQFIQMQQSNWMIMDDLSATARSMDTSNSDVVMTRVCGHTAIDVHDLTQTYELVSLDRVADAIVGSAEKHQSAFGQQIENELVDEMLQLQIAQCGNERILANVNREIPRPNSLPL